MGSRLLPGLLAAICCFCTLNATAQIDCVDYAGAIVPAGGTTDPTSNALVLDGQFIHQGGLVYTDSTGTTFAAALTTLDISTPEQPAVVGALPLLNAGGNPLIEGVLSLCQSGSTLYAACGVDGLLIIDISDPANPVQQGILTTATTMTEARVVGGVAAIIEEVDASSGTRLVTADVTNPNQPVVLGQSSPMFKTGAEMLPVAGLAYVTTTDGGIYIYDLSLPVAPTAILVFSPLGGLAGAPLGLYLEGQTLTVGLGTALAEYDVTDPRNPVEGAFRAVAAGHRIMKANGRLVSSMNGFLIVGEYNQTILDPYAAFLPAQGTAGMAVATATHLYRSGVGAGLQIQRANAWLIPSHVASAETVEPGERLALSGDLLYCATGTDTTGLLEIVDVSDAAAPVTVGSVALPATAKDVGVTNGVVCLAMGDAGLWLMDATDPLAPVHTGTATATGPVRRVVGRGGLAYCAANLGGVLIVDTSNPSVPQIVASIGLPGATVAVALDGDRLYTVSAAGRLTVLDIGNPAAPVELGSVVTGYQFTAVTAHNGFVLTGDTAGVSVVDAVDPTQLVEVSRIDLPSPDGPDQTGVLDISVAASYAYVGQVDGRLAVIDVSNPLAAVPVGGGIQVASLAWGVAARADAVFVLGGNLAVMAPQCASVSAVPAGPLPNLSLRFAGARPNPFNPMTSLAFEVTTPQRVTVDVYDLAGRRIVRLADREFAAGRHEVLWNGRDEAGRGVGSGVYLARVSGEGGGVAGRMTLVR